MYANDHIFSEFRGPNFVPMIQIKCYWNPSDPSIACNFISSFCLLCCSELSEVLWKMALSRAISIGMVYGALMGALCVFGIFSFWAGEFDILKKVSYLKVTFMNGYSF